MLKRNNYQEYFSNIPTKLTEFINRNCTQDAIKRTYIKRTFNRTSAFPNLNFSREVGEEGGRGLREGETPSCAFPVGSRGTLSVDHFSKAGDDPELGLTEK